MWDWISLLSPETGVDASKIARKVDLANLEFNVDELDIDEFKIVQRGLSSWKSNIGKLETNPFGLSKLNNVTKKWSC